MSEPSLFDLVYQQTEKAESVQTRLEAVVIPAAEEKPVASVIANKLSNFAKEVERLGLIVEMTKDVARKQSYRAIGLEKLETAVATWDGDVLAEINEKLSPILEIEGTPRIVSFLEKYRASTSKQNYDDPAKIQDGVFLSKDNIELTNYMPHQIKSIASALNKVMISKEFAQKEILATTSSLDVEKLGVSASFSGVIETTGQIKMPENEIKDMLDPSLVEERLTDTLKKKESSSYGEEEDLGVSMANSNRGM